MMDRGENLDSIPTDLFLEIFSRLPAKSVARSCCVLKLWGSMLGLPYFTELFLTRSSARPRLLFLIKKYGVWSFFSLPQPQNPYGKSSLVVAADSHMKLSGGISRYSISYAAGLIYLHNLRIPKKDSDAMRVICSPITGQCAILPELIMRRRKREYSLLGFDPIDKQFKVLLIKNMVYNETVHYILTLGTDKVKWRKIQCPLIHYPFGNKEICINGVLYYLAHHIDGDTNPVVVVCIDVRSEKFRSIDAGFFPFPYRIKLINYKGKLGGIHLESAGYTHELRMWVLEDVEKQEWSKYVYTLPENNEVVKSYKLSVVGVTATGEIVLSNFYNSNQLYVFYFNPERNTLLSVEIQGFENASSVGVYGFVDHVEGLNFNIMKTTYAATSTSPPEHERINII